MSVCSAEQVQIVRGDTLLMTVRVVAESITDSATCRLTVADASSTLMNKVFHAETIGVFKVWLEPTDTQTLLEGEYRLGVVIEDHTTTPVLKKQAIRSLRVFAGVGE